MQQMSFFLSLFFTLLADLLMNACGPLLKDRCEKDTPSEIVSGKDTKKNLAV